MGNREKWKNMSNKLEEKLIKFHVDNISDFFRENKEEMVTKEDINKKALQELLYYYLNERISKQNTALKYLIATNIYELFVWDANLFEKKFYNNKDFLWTFCNFL